MRPLPAGVLVGALCAAAAGASAALPGHGPASVAGAAVLGAGLGAAREAPRAAWVVAVAGLLVAAPGGTGDLLAPLLLTPAHAFAAALREGRRGGVVALVALTAAWELGVLLDGGWGGPALLLTVAAWAAGRALRERDRLAAQLAWRARELEEERALHAASSVRYERARIAAELHDLVAHAISVVVVQAGAGQRLAARDPVATAEVFTAIAGAARQAEHDVERLVAVLGAPGDLHPAPDLALVEELVARAAGAGLDVTLRVEGERGGWPAEVAHAAYHVVQEGLTNALRHAAGADVLVRVRAGVGELSLEVDSGPPEREGTLTGAGAGLGLQGLRERVTAAGGSLAAGPDGRGGWRLAARLPTGAE